MLFIIIYFVLFLVAFCRVTSGWCYSKVCLVGKTAIITGGNSGIGFQTAVALASRGCRVIIADKDDAADSRHRIVEATNNKNVTSWKLDLASLASVRKFAEHIIKTENNLDILINNAGIGSTATVYTEDGLHRTMQVNYLGHFLLTYLLLDLLKKSAPSRVIFTSSIAAFYPKLKLQDLNPIESCPEPYRVYPNSKLCQIIAASYLSEKLKGSSVTVNCAHPGGVKSGIYWNAFREEKSIFPIIFGLLTLPFGKNTEQGAQTTIYLACEKSLEDVTGKFFVDCFQFIQPLQAYDKEFCKEVWDYSKRLVKLRTEECTI